MVRYITFFLLLLFWSCEKESEPDTIPPTVLIISPDDGLTVSDSVIITCISTDNEGVEKVELYVNDVPIDITYERESYTLSWNISSTDSSSYTIIRSQPYALYWDTENYDDGIYTVSVRSYDVNENITDSEPITLIIRKFVELWGASYSVENTTTLSLHDNQLTGSIPQEIGNLTSLTHLYLNDNQLSGPIPQEIGNLVSLVHLYLHNNQLSGPIPPEIGNLNGLTGLLLYDNHLSGSIPSEIGNLTSLEVLYLSDNQLNGEIPWSICNLVDINCLIFLNNNLLCPSYPSCIEDNVQYQDTSDCP